MTSSYGVIKRVSSPGRMVELVGGFQGTLGLTEQEQRVGVKCRAQDTATPAPLAEFTTNSASISLAYLSQIRHGLSKSSNEVPDDL